MLKISTASGIVCLVFGAATLKWLRSRYAQPKLPFPPGPPERWFLGNFFDLTFDKPWVRFTEWEHQYGGLVHFRVLHMHSFIVNNLEVARELFERRSNTYSDRPKFLMVDLMGWDYNTVFAHYGDAWRAQRRMLQQAYKPESARKYQDIQTQKVHDMAYLLLNVPDDFVQHIRHESGAIIMSAVYGHDVQYEHDYFVEVAEKAADELAKGLMLPVNFLPFLLYIPEWMPGGGFKKLAREGRIITSKMLSEPLDMVKANMASGKGRPCIATELLESHTTDDGIHHTKCVCATSYAAGADTTVSSVETFFYTMVKFADIQKKAQEEIDRVVGKDRLPTYADRPLMPYSEALLREVLRWHPVTPLAPGRATTADDVYEGYQIPKGSTVLINIWAISRDPSKYDDPEAFNPSRFFKENGELNDDDVHYVFGLGRRVCPGRHLASATVWLSIVTVLACFDITKKRDANGEEIPVDSGYSGSLLCHPLPFQCSIKPRSEEAKTLILNTRA